MRFLGWLFVLLVLIGIGTGAYFLGGFFNVAANWEDSPPVAKALTSVREASIARQIKASTIPAIAGDQAAVQSGAKAFAKYGCATCHGAPGVEWSKLAEGLNPSPPDLKEIGNADTPQKIFWVVKNGIRMTGMPSFAKAGATDQEIASIAAFVKKFGSVSETDYKSWTAQP